MSPERTAASLSATYLGGLSDIAHLDGPAGWARLEQLRDWLTNWYRRDDDRRKLWAFIPQQWRPVARSRISRRRWPVPS